MNKDNSTIGFGAFKGVYIPSILTILGVILFLRLGWVVGNVGLIATLVIVTIASAITFVTGLSISATATNMQVGGGGAYYMISRSFGIEAGAAVGLPLYLAQALGVTFYLSGFAEAVYGIFPIASIQSIALVTLVLITLVSYFSADLALKTQFFIFALIAASLLSFALGKPIDPALASEITQLPPKVPFWQVFAVFFTAVTGIEAGISMSGDLKEPRSALPKGTLGAVVTGYFVYVAIPIALYYYVPEEILRTDSLVMLKVAKVPQIILLGVWGATLSSAMGAILGGPRTLQALAQDHVLPRILARGSGKSNEPRIATIFTFFVAALGLLLGDLNVIAPVLSMFFLTSYGCLNLIAGFEGMIGNPSWRPSFKTPWALSLIGSFACFGVMMMIDAGASFIALTASISIYFLMLKRNLNSGWSDMRRGLLNHLARYSIYRLNNHEEEARTWRPHMLALSGAPKSRWYLIEIANSITHGKGFLTVSSVLTDPHATREKLRNLESAVREFLEKRNVPALVKVTNASTLVDGIRELINGYGIGTLVPNTFIFGESERRENFEDFTLMLQMIFFARRNTLIVREDSRAKKIDNKVRQIDVWWGRQNNNASLMLTLAFLIQTSPEWKGAQLNLKTLVTDREEHLGVFNFLEQFIKKSRIDANVRCMPIESAQNPLAAVREHSKGSDLVFLGMRPPDQNESNEAYSLYYEHLIQTTEDMPLTLIALSGEDIKFKEIFE